MGTTGTLKQISPLMLDKIKDDSLLIESFLLARWLPNSAHWHSEMGKPFFSPELAEDSQQSARREFEELKRRYRFKHISRFHWVSQHWISQIEIEWDKLEAEFLLEWQIPELDLYKIYYELHCILTGDLLYHSFRDMPPFLVIRDSEWDNRPLINAVFAGVPIAKKEINYTDLQYLPPHEVKEVAEGLSELSEIGFRERCKRESTRNCIDLGGEDEETIDWFTDYYNKLTTYYREATEKGNAMLLYFG